MVQLKASEKRLLILFGVLAFIAVNVLVFQWIIQREQKLVTDKAQLESQKQRLQALIGERSTWMGRKSWLDAHLPVYRTIDDRDTHLITLVRERSSTADVDIVAGPNALEAGETANFEETLVNVTAQGEIEEIVRWLYSLQAPNDFRALTSMKLLRAKKGSTELRCEITLAQWWSLNSREIILSSQQAVPSATPPTAEAAETAASRTPQPDATVKAKSKAEPKPEAEAAQEEASKQKGAGATPAAADAKTLEEAQRAAREAAQAARAAALKRNGDR